MAERHDLRVLLVGDVRQHVSVEAGDFLRVLEAHSRIARCEVGEIHRQIPKDYRAAIIEMANGNIRGGLEALDRMSWIREGQSDYLRQAAADYLRLTGPGKAGCIAVSFTWEENHRFTEAIREGLKERGVLPREGASFTVYESLRWTNQQKRDFRRYEAGQVVTFVPGSGQSGTATVARIEQKGVVVTDNEGREIRLNLRRPDTFDVCKTRVVEISENDKVLIRANDKRLGLVNGQVLTISKVEPDGTLRTKEGTVVPGEFRQWCHGYVVTSHKAQGWTADHVVVAAENFTAKGAYVACSRGRLSCTIHTPDKLRLMERLPEGNRRAALDMKPEVGMQALRNRPVVWERIFKQNSLPVIRHLAQKSLSAAQHITQTVLHQEPEDRQGHRSDLKL